MFSTLDGLLTLVTVLYPKHQLTFAFWCKLSAKHLQPAKQATPGLTNKSNVFKGLVYDALLTMSENKGRGGGGEGGGSGGGGSGEYGVGGSKESNEYGGGGGASGAHQGGGGGGGGGGGKTGEVILDLDVLRELPMKEALQELGAACDELVAPFDKKNTTQGNQGEERTLKDFVELAVSVIEYYPNSEYELSIGCATLCAVGAWVKHGAKTHKVMPTWSRFVRKDIFGAVVGIILAGHSAKLATMACRALTAMTVNSIDAVAAYKAVGVLVVTILNCVEADVASTDTAELVRCACEALLHMVHKVEHNQTACWEARCGDDGVSGVGALLRVLSNKGFSAAHEMACDTLGSVMDNHCFNKDAFNSCGGAAILVGMLDNYLDNRDMVHAVCWALYVATWQHTENQSSCLAAGVFKAVIRVCKKHVGLDCLTPVLEFAGADLAYFDEAMHNEDGGYIMAVATAGMVDAMLQSVWLKFDSTSDGGGTHSWLDGSRTLEASIASSEGGGGTHGGASEGESLSGTHGGTSEGGSLNGTRGGASEGGSLSGTRGGASEGGSLSGTRWADRLSLVPARSSVTSNASKSFKPPSSEEIRTVFVEAADKCFGAHEVPDGDGHFDVKITDDSIMRFVVYQAQLGSWYGGRSCFLPDGMAKAFMDFVKSILTSVADVAKLGMLIGMTAGMAKAANTPPLLESPNNFTFARALGIMLGELLEDWQPLNILTQKHVDKIYKALFNAMPRSSSHYFGHPKRLSGGDGIGTSSLVDVKAEETVAVVSQEEVSKNVVDDAKASNEKGAEQDATKSTEEDAEQDSKASPMKIPRMTPK